ncbi:MAG TPA: hypothetical protein VEB86_16325, partial [Chryseosolibacter sp.]|nr:hypothetical protein [Chryseosolibacter sp.]
MNLTRFSDASFAAFSLAVIITVQCPELIAGDSLKDSSQTSVAQKKSNMRLTARIHSVGLFAFAGLIANENPAIDLAFTYERTYWNVLVVKAVDVYDIHSPYDFTLALVYANYKLGPRVTVTPYAGFVLEQTHSVAGEGSDAMALIVTSYRLAKHFSLEHTGRFSNLVMDRESFDWLNRVRA